MKVLKGVLAEAIIANCYPTKGSFRLSAVRKGSGQIDTVLSCNLLDGACTVTGVDVDSSGSSKKLARTAVLEVVRQAYCQSELDVSSGIVRIDGYAPVMVLQVDNGLILGSFVAEYDSTIDNKEAEEVNVLTAVALAVKSLLGWTDHTVANATERFLYSVWGGGRLSAGRNEVPGRKLFRQPRRSGGETVDSLGGRSDLSSSWQTLIRGLMVWPGTEVPGFSVVTIGNGAGKRENDMIK